jgi:hypothetical protein
LGCDDQQFFRFGAEAAKLFILRGSMVHPRQRPCYTTGVRIAEAVASHGQEEQAKAIAAVAELHGLLKASATSSTGSRCAGSVEVTSSHAKAFNAPSMRGVRRVERHYLTAMLGVRRCVVWRYHTDAVPAADCSDSTVGRSQFFSTAYQIRTIPL